MSHLVEEAKVHEEIDRFMRRLKIWLGILVSAFFIAIAVYTFAVEHRMQVFRESLSYRPPVEAGDLDTEDTAALTVPLSGTLRRPVRGQLVYLPVYSHVYHQAGKPHLLTVTVSVRNTSPDTPVQIESVRYYDTQGKPIKSFLKSPMKLGPLATGEFLVARDDTSGGSGANFLVQWAADTDVSPPVVEAVMIDTSSQQGISFVRGGVVVRETRASE